jgi:hypothetical protein
VHHGRDDGDLEVFATPEDKPNVAAGVERSEADAHVVRLATTTGLKRATPDRNVEVVLAIAARIQLLISIQVDLDARAAGLEADDDAERAAQVVQNIALQLQRYPHHEVLIFMNDGDRAMGVLRFEEFHFHFGGQIPVLVLNFNDAGCSHGGLPFVAGGRTRLPVASIDIDRETVAPGVHIAVV